eukprot:TRINITY_DN25011_c0_g1_i1.p1 TRINITY_DN25011_c0_g1~~TRINITY_DN25011_c0_g1_i1.p1  ORF type:complete len:236 (+),score=24.69 TRINITY_DN25011_c0_g1_i1:60-767(+)
MAVTSLTMKSKYKKIRLIGKGSLGVVWLVENEDDNGEYVAKFIDTNYSNEPELKANIALRNELKSPYLVDHTNTFKDEANCRVIIMEHCSGIVGQYEIGGSLADLIGLHVEEGRLISEGEVRQLLKGIGKALSFLHSKKIPHRSLKPENILLTKKKAIKLADYGGAQFKDVTSDSTLCSNAEPDQEMAHDIWALGCILYELCTLKVTPHAIFLSLIHICRCRRYAVCRSRWSPYH